jgi:hypothetical protein
MPERASTRGADFGRPGLEEVARLAVDWFTHHLDTERPALVGRSAG